jgi:tetratricopeptide (TPR) repeat protein
VIDATISTPDWVMPAFLLRRANNRMLLNDPGAADDARSVAGNKQMRTFHEAAQRQLAAIGERRPDEGAIYAELIPANRMTVEHRWNEAQAAYERAAAAHPEDWQVKYRLAYLDFERRGYDAAARGLEPIVSTSAKIPRWLRAAAMLNLAWTYDIGGRRAEAVKLYKKVVDDYEDQSAANGARLGLLSPYRPRSPNSTSAADGDALNALSVDPDRRSDD